MFNVQRPPPPSPQQKGAAQGSRRYKLGSSQHTQHSVRVPKKAAAHQTNRRRLWNFLIRLLLLLLLLDQRVKLVGDLFIRSTVCRRSQIRFKVLTAVNASFAPEKVLAVLLLRGPNWLLLCSCERVNKGINLLIYRFLCPSRWSWFYKEITPLPTLLDIARACVLATSDKLHKVPCKFYR